MNEVKVSIIVPVYNAEATLRRCIDSVLSQPLADWELLLVDDGSRDSSPTLCDEYAAADARIKAIHKENGGVSSARNVGLSQARGEWICFVDSDDMLTEDALSPDLTTYAADMLIFPQFRRNGEVIGKRSNSEWGEYSGEEVNRFLEKSLSRMEMNAVWGKLVKRETIGELRFDETIPIGEDTLFMLRLMKNVRSLWLLPHIMYVYTTSPADFKKKYNFEIKDLISYLWKIETEYLNLGINSEDFEKNKFCDFKGFGQEKINQTPALWYKDERVKFIYGRIKTKLTRNYRIRYALASCPLLVKIKHHFSK